jgi:hypothetical protein
MKNRNKAYTATLVALAFAFAAVVKAGPYIDGGPTHLKNKFASANSGGGAKSSKPDDVLPGTTLSFAPFGLTLNQTARLNLVNMDVANGITVSWRFMDAKGAIIAQSATTLEVGKIVSVDFKRQSSPLRDESPVALRAEMQVQVDIITYNASSESLRRSLEVFDNNTGATLVHMGGGS